MGIMKCPIHGRSEFVEVCSHVATQIGAGEYLSGHRFDVLGHLLICDACFNSLGFDKCLGLAGIASSSFDAGDPKWTIYDAAYDGVEGRVGFCLKCFAELEQQSRPTDL